MREADTPFLMIFLTGGFREEKNSGQWHFRERRIDHQNCGTENQNRRKGPPLRKHGNEFHSPSIHVWNLSNLFSLRRFFPVHPGKGHNKDREKGRKWKGNGRKIAWERSVEIKDLFKRQKKKKKRQKAKRLESTLFCRWGSGNRFSR
ncbi:hypothetical protein CEXT_184301 [Caerostris extrusa]|uniref:Uncharacterized protein n=1 Tax=Caerostris extrusa TaxID=172846 RepID=A0AAV4MJV1_CAEEX|nr:hypothetical protein CEXT_184301 [Caerostris extrusa]